MRTRGAPRTGTAGFAAAFAVAILAASAACSDGYGTSGPDFMPPADHTVRRGGFLHAPGATEPLANCAECHGADLMGGADGEPSCYRCHGAVWQERVPAP